MNAGTPDRMVKAPLGPRPAQFHLGFLKSRWVRLTMMVGGIVLAYALPILQPPVITTPDSDFGGVMVSAASFALVAVGLNIVIGYAGLLDLGYVGFYAVGAYTVGVLTSEHGHWPFLLLLPVAAVIAMISGVLLGAPTLRVRGDYLAIVTLGFGEIIRLIAVNWGWVGAASGISDVPKPPSLELFKIPHLVWNGGVASIDLDTTTTFVRFGVLDQVPYYWLALTVILLILLADKALQTSRVGRAWEA